MIGPIASLAILALPAGVGIWALWIAIGNDDPDWDQPLPPRRAPHTPRPHYPTGAGNHAHHKKHPEGEQ